MQQQLDRMLMFMPWVKANSTAGVTTDGIRCRITGVLNDIELPNTYYQRLGAR